MPNQSLDDVLAEVERLRCDLSAEVVLQEERGHFEIHYGYGGRGGYTWDKEIVEKKIWVIDTERLTKPNAQKREEARQELQQVYDNNKLYSARYVAGRVLGIKALKTRVKQWIHNLADKLDAKREEQIWDQYTGEAGPSTAFVRRPELDTLIGIKIVEDSAITYPAAEDTIKLFELSGSEDARELVKKVYTKISSDSLRIKAGKALGYSNLKIWTDEHPVATLLGVVATSGVVVGLGTMIYQYLSR